jgi:hypothetical protein
MKITVDRNSTNYLKEATITTDSMIDLVLMKYALREHLEKTPNCVKYRVEAMIHEFDEATRDEEINKREGNEHVQSQSHRFNRPSRKRSGAAQYRFRNRGGQLYSRR